MKEICTLVLFALTIEYSAGQGTWTQLPDFPGGARYGATSIVIGGKAYVGLGANFDDSAVFDDWWEYDPSANTWTLKANFPSSIYFAAAISINGNCYVGLGLTSSGNPLTTWYEYNPATDSWTAKASFPGNGRYGCATFTIDGIGYLCCGNEGNASGPFSKELWSYDPTNDSWIKKKTFPGKSRSRAVSFSLFGNGYVEGGGRLNVNGIYKCLDDMYEYNPSTNSWTQKASFPGDGDSGQACFVTSTQAYIGLGERLENYNRSFYAYNPTNNTWHSDITEFGGDGREDMCSFSIANLGYVILGKNVNKQGYYDDVWEYSTGLPKIFEGGESAREPFVNYTQIVKTLIPSFKQNEKIISFDFKLYDLSGRLIQSQIISENAIIYLDAALPKGIYLAVTSNGKTNSVQKILIQ